MNLEYPNIRIKNTPKNIKNLFYKDICAVAVHYCIYDKKKKTIIHYGSSRPCGYNYHKSSIHVEQLAINYCNLHVKNINNIKIIIWKWNKKGNIKSAFCCRSCSQIINKYNYNNLFYTIDDSNDKLISSLVDNPTLTLSYMIKYDLKY
jgi:hypothetical protein